MKQILIFGGTTEGRILANTLSKAKIICTVCVATEYGEEMLKKNDYINIHCGRMNEKEMIEFLKKEDYFIVIDATHPYALEVSKNIKSASKTANILYIRLKRKNENIQKQSFIHIFNNNQECVEYLEKTKGNILLTTGSKEIPVYTNNNLLKERIVARVLPVNSSIDICHENGIDRKHIIAMQGPFSVRMNESFIKEYNIKYMVTKECGRTGGFEEKIEAVKNSLIEMCVIKNPEKEEGLSFEEVYSFLKKEYGISIRNNEDMITNNQKITLIGIGMGNSLTITKEVECAINNAEVIFGAKRILECIQKMKHRENCDFIPYYQAKDIVPFVLENKSIKKIVVAFSGDTGFFSGSTQFVKFVKENFNIYFEKGYKVYNYDNN